MELKTIIFMGRSGCGKGTQAHLIGDVLKEKDSNADVIYIGTGKKIREFVKGNGFTNRLSEKVYATGLLQPSFLAVKMWSDEFIEKIDGSKHIILDGTSRRLIEAHVLENALDFYERDNVYVIYLNISREVSKKRLLSRGRRDDSNDDIDKRLDWYDKDVQPVVDYYEHSSRYEFLDIDGEQSLEEIHDDIIKRVFKHDS